MNIDMIFRVFGIGLMVVALYPNLKTWQVIVFAIGLGLAIYEYK